MGDLGESEGTTGSGLAAIAESSPPGWMLGLGGGVFSALGAAALGAKKDLPCLVEMDLGRRFRIDEAEMVPRNRDSPAVSVEVVLGFIVSLR